jgi:exosortase/archaeosortase family protein
MIFIVALICSYPGRWKRKLLYSILGIVFFIILNILRFVALVFIIHAYPKQIDFNHDYVFNVIVYILVFLFWILMIKRGQEKVKTWPGILVFYYMCITQHEFLLHCNENGTRKNWKKLHHSFRFFDKIIISQYPYLKYFFLITFYYFGTVASQQLLQIYSLTRQYPSISY